MVTVNEINENVSRLKAELDKINVLIHKEILSIILDGSLIRGDFINYSSDIDLTITTSCNKIKTETQQLVKQTIKSVENTLPKRHFPNKPLVYDLQWQSLNTVKETGTRLPHQWNSTNIPSGYPKLWLYAFDSIKHHRVIYGQDITTYYSKLPTKNFVPIRLQRIKNSAERVKGNVSSYEAQYGAISQIKNAWEAIRCVCIAQD
ncbi:hypothetical protein IMX26_15760 [Clostridium sp. 'deep sea']|uniref:hypothetical protein n=1 Tax=Clostridium sp. 'deep sea' TaxID=2779445 RepID=UPI0018963E99|nr:hypothetical protein [Clostridium sp. 'deep sea']QOR34896.1 hypothetical protein IMX26_15760 [Clostridium sp. 'deep sea']